MRRLRGLSWACFLSVMTIAPGVLAQEPAPPPPIAPPPPMNPSTPGSPAGPGGTPGAPGTPDSQSGAAGETTKKLDEAEQKDSGRKFELFWLDAHIGGSYINMRQFS